MSTDIDQVIAEVRRDARRTVCLGLYRYDPAPTAETQRWQLERCVAQVRRAFGQLGRVIEQAGAAMGRIGKAFASATDDTEEKR
jgi:hypothetical protein